MRELIAALEGSRIREVANVGLGRADVLPFWFGESDETTADFIRQAAIESLQRGETFYAHNLGMPELRQALADYTARWHPSQPATQWAERIAVTSGGVNALMLACEALVDAGDEVVAVTPVWPNLVAQPRIMGACLQTVSLRPDAGGAWQLDMAELLAAVTPRTRLLVLNAPNNPTGWTLTRAEQQEILNHCRQTGTWILADEVYERLYFDGEAGQPAPSLLDLATPDDRLVVAHSFSKTFLMTGWRLGWLVMPPFLVPAMGKLIEFNTSCAPVFVQRGAIEALRLEPTLVPALQQHMRACRDVLVSGLRAVPRVMVEAPEGGMYAFLRVDGVSDSLAFARELVLRHGLGLAPGAAFGPEGEGWLRWCFASRDTQRLRLGVERLAAALQRP